MSETQPQDSTPQKNTNYTILGLRVIQILSMALAIVGGIWSSGDYLTSLFPKDSVVTPVSVLLMLYGTIGTFSLEGIINFLSRKK